MLSSGKDDDVIIRNYLLGLLSDEDREEFERRYFGDEELFDKVQAAEDDLIDDFLCGNLSQADVDMFHQHFLVGRKREQQLRVGKAWRNFAVAHASEKPPKPVNAPNWWQSFFQYAPRIGAVAGLIVVAAIGVWQFIIPSQVDKALYALNAAYKQERPLHSRITELDYAPYDVTRGSDSRNVDQNELNEAELTLQTIVNRKPTPEAHHALGKVFLAKKEFNKAIEQFELALKGNPNNAQTYTDLGAALLEKGKLEVVSARSDSSASGKGVESYARSLTNLNTALQKDPNLLEALYNRALLHEAMGLLPQAEEDWRKYLEKDPSSKWAAEARERLTRIEQERKKTAETSKEIFERFLSESNSGNEDAVWKVVSDQQNRSGNVVVEQLIDDYLAAGGQNQKEDAHQAMQRLASVGELQLRKAGDRFFFDLARFYESATPEQRGLVLKARELMKQGYEGWGRIKTDENLRLFKDARDLFGQARDHPEAFVAEYWMSFCHHNEHRIKQSRQTLDPVLLASQQRHYLWLQVRGLFLLSSLESQANEHSKAVASSLRAVELATQTNDSVGLLNAMCLLIESYRTLSSYAESLTWIQRGLPLLSSSRDPIQAMRYFTLAASAFATIGLHDAALGFQREALRFAFITGRDGAKSQNYAFLGAIQGKLKNFDEALKNVQLAFDTAQTIKASSQLAYAALQMGNIYREAGDCDKAVDRYTESINIYKTLDDLETHKYNAHKGRVLCYLQQHNDALTQEEFSILFDLIDKYRRKISDQGSRNTFFDVEQSVVDSAIDFEYSRMNNSEQAFNYSNSSRARSLFDLLTADADVKAKVQKADIKFQAVSEPRSLEAIKNQLPAQTQVVQYVVLENKLLFFVISRNSFQVQTQPISKRDLNEKLLRFLNIVSRPPQDDESQELLLSKDLYSILIKPVETLLDKQKLLCIIPDGTLSYLPFAALVSPESGKYLFEDRALMTAPSPSVFLTCSENALQKTGLKAERVLSVGNPTFDRAAYREFDDLPEAGREATEVGSLYESRDVLNENSATRPAVKNHIETSDVAHLALHTKVDDEVPLRSKLLLAKAPATSALDQDSVIYAYEIYNLKLSQTRLVVLSSCESGAGRYYGGEGVNSLARAFIGAGVPLVVASLWPVQSSATERLMVSFHTNRTKEHRSTVEALRSAQQQMARGPAENFRRPYYWAAFTVTGGYAEF